MKNYADAYIQHVKNTMDVLGKKNIKVRGN